MTFKQFFFFFSTLWLILSKKIKERARERNPCIAKQLDQKSPVMEQGFSAHTALRNWRDVLKGGDEDMRRLGKEEGTEEGVWLTYKQTLWICMVKKKILWKIHFSFCFLVSLPVYQISFDVVLWKTNNDEKSNPPPFVVWFTAFPFSFYFIFFFSNSRQSYASKDIRCEALVCSNLNFANSFPPWIA